MSDTWPRSRRSSGPNTVVSDILGRLTAGEGRVVLDRELGLGWLGGGGGFGRK